MNISIKEAYGSSLIRREAWCYVLGISLDAEYTPKVLCREVWSPQSHVNDIPGEWELNPIIVSGRW